MDKEAEMNLAEAGSTYDTPMPISHLFRGKSLVDVSVIVSKFDSMMDFRPYLLKAFDLTDADVERWSHIQKGCLAKTGGFAGSITVNAGYLYDRVPNRIHDALVDTIAGVMSAFIDKNLSMGVWTDKAQHLLLRYGMDIVSSLLEQMSFLWYSFKERRPCIDMVTKEACELVNSTRLDTNITKEMLNDAFAEDRYMCLAVPLYGCTEIVCMMREGHVYVCLGHTSIHGTRVPRPFVCVGRIDIYGLIGRMTRQNAVSDAVWQQRLNGAEHDKQLAVALLPDDENEKQKEERYTVLGFGVADQVLFALKLRILLGMQKTPMEQLCTSKGKSVFLDGVSTPPEKRGISYSVVSLTKEFRKAKNEWQGEGRKLDKFGKNLISKQIAGFIRKQHYGEGNKLSKLIYIAPFTNRFWVNSGVHITKIVK